MKRTLLMLDPNWVAKAMRRSKETSASDAILRARGGFARRRSARGILALRGSGLWNGDLAAMRRDPFHNDTAPST